MNAISMSAIYGCGSRGTDETLVHPLSVEELTVSATPSLAAQAPIVFRSDRGQPGIGDLYVMALDGSSVRRLTEGGDFYVPAWSPNGETIAFRYANGVSKSIGLLPTEGGTPVSVTSNDEGGQLERPVHWSPDGQRIAYEGLDDANRSRIWEIARTGGQRRRLIPDDEFAQSSAEWAWRGETRLLYTLWNGPGDSDIWIAELSTNAEPRNLTNQRIAAPSYPRWSPDGTRIALVAFPLANDGSIEGLGNHGESGAQLPDPEVFVIDTRDGELLRLTDNTFEESGLAWSPDGNSLIVASDADGDTDLWLIPLAAPDEARNLIDDASLPAEDYTPDWYWGPR